MDLKNLLSTVVAVVSVIAGAVNAYLQSVGTGEINWFQLAGFIIVAVLGLFQGRNSDLSKKTPTQVVTETKVAKDTKPV